MTNKPILNAFAGIKNERLPVWFMRQAGRYLPEYRALRAEAGSFLDLCYNADFATEVTLQPIRRFGFDGAILFSDILVIPHALGLDLHFAEGEGPILSKVGSAEDVRKLEVNRTEEHLQPVFDTVENLARELPQEVTLIGFCGAPWTVASYMIAGRGTPDQAPIRMMAYKDPELLDSIIDVLVDSSIIYLRKQVEAGAQALQIFDTWAGVVAHDQFERWVSGPIGRIVRGVKDMYPDVPIIGFAKGTHDRCGDFAKDSFVDGVGLDWTADLSRIELDQRIVTQGNLDPIALLVGGERMKAQIESIKSLSAGKNHIFNLGHGIIKETPIRNVEEALDIIRE